jgi:Flp pilus assembly protein TadG
MTRDRMRGNEEDGQVLTVFALALVAIIAMTGIVMDGGSVLVQRRGQQNVADAAALAGSYAWLNTGAPGQAITAARDAAAANGYTHGTNNVQVDVTTGTGIFGSNAVTVVVSRPHHNNFATIVGMPTWDVSATATANVGAPNSARGAMPLLFNRAVFQYGTPTVEVTYGEPTSGNNDIPLGTNQFNWTVYCIAQGGSEESCNADSQTVDALIKFENERDQEVTIGVDEIRPLNAGAHATLFSEMASHIGEEFPVSIVDDAGVMVGWAFFHLTGSSGGSTKALTGYFILPVNEKSIYIASAGGTGTSAFGAYTVWLSN